MGLKVINVEAKDIHVTLEMSLTELRQLRDALNATTVEVNSEEEPRIALAAKFLTAEFFPFINELVEDLSKDVTRPDSTRG